MTEEIERAKVKVQKNTTLAVSSKQSITSPREYKRKEKTMWTTRIM